MIASPASPLLAPVGPPTGEMPDVDMTPMAWVKATNGVSPATINSTQSASVSKA